jgi:hypothetical protein
MKKLASQPSIYHTMGSPYVIQVPVSVRKVRLRIVGDVAGSAPKQFNEHRRLISSISTNVVGVDRLPSIENDSMALPRSD